MRFSITRSGLMLMIGILALGIGVLGCGNSEETPEEQNTTQTRAMVPGTVGQDSEATSGVEDEIPANETAEPMTDPGGQPANATGEGEPSGEAMTAGAEGLEEIPPPPPASEKVVRELEKSAAQTPPPPPAPGKGLFSLQLGSHTVASFAEEKAQELRDKGYPATVEPADVKGQLYHRVFIRGLADRPSAEKLGDKLRAEMGLDYLVRERK